MVGPERRTHLERKLLEHLEVALAIADELKSGAVGLLIQTALDQVRAGTRPRKPDLPPRSRH
jgi:hypothetical protein